MKDIFIPIILFATTILATVFFLNKIYEPQQQTMNVIAENSQSSSFAVTHVSDGNNESVSGSVVKSTIDYYSVDESKKVIVRKGVNEATYILNKYEEGSDMGASAVINNSEKYEKEVVRDNDTHELTAVWFTLK
ncbi:MAG TPA: hypothetical protein DCP90_03845 [Clostridiales bacterium]|nr:MAG: hypothetical protein A2Y22_03990 [Clostridiales bacterium GWD2_32_59]HAN09728.1 hypothetical protein [Clostridiales bacterium]